MARLLKNNEMYSNDATVIDADTDINALDGVLLVPVKLWNEKQALYDRADKTIGLFFEPDDEPESIQTALSRFPVIAVDFPKFMDGRGYSIARILRDRFGFEGEIRATGDVLIDQIFAMKRCGFSSFLLREDQKAEDALKALDTFTLRYQGSSDDPEPLYRKRA